MMITRTPLMVVSSPFWKTAVEGKPGKEVAKLLGMSVAAVYLAKSRVVARFQALIHEMQEEEDNPVQDRGIAHEPSNLS